MATMLNDGWVEPTRKRSREPEEVMNIHGFDDHRDKRQQSLPLRTSPTQKRWSDPATYPADSDYQGRPAMQEDRDADMMVDESMSSTGQSSVPSYLNPTGPDTGGRMPTPINATFAAQVRGNNCQAQPFIATPGQDPSVPRSIEATRELAAGLSNHRRLPSPISESGGEDASSRSPGMILDSAAPIDPQQRPYLPHMPHSTNPGAVGLLHPNIESDPHMLAPCAESSDDGMMDAEGSPSSAPASPSPGRKIGHCRSKHTLNSWTSNQPGMKKSFSIGYRADCEKCRLKIPGHFNHIIVS